MKCFAIQRLTTCRGPLLFWAMAMKRSSSGLVHRLSGTRRGVMTVTHSQQSKNEGMGLVNKQTTKLAGLTLLLVAPLAMAAERPNILVIFGDDID